MDPKEHITKDRSTWTVDEHIAHERELAEKRKAWEEQKKWEDEEQERKEKQARMEAFLRSRGQSWHDHTGSLPPPHVMESWQLEYLAERAAEEERERQRRLAQAADNAAI